MNTTTVTHTGRVDVISSTWGTHDTFRVATIVGMPISQGYIVKGYENGEGYIAGTVDATATAVSYARALVLARGYVTEAFTFCPDCGECVAYEDSTETWCHLAPSSDCYLAFTNGGN